MSTSCPLPSPEILEEARRAFRRHMTENPVVPIDEQAIIQALEYPATDYFITTDLFWDCDCEQRYIRPADMPTCENCGADQDECPPSRINEIWYFGIHVDWMEPAVLNTLEEHSTGSRRRTSSPLDDG